MRGRKPTPTAALVARGSKHAKDRTGEPKPDPIAPTAPAHLDKTALAEWDRIAPLLEGLGLLAKIDRTALAMYCTAYSRWVRAEADLVENGEIVMSSQGNPTRNPYLDVANKAMEQMAKLLQEFGMSPSSRTRVNANPNAGKRPAPKPSNGPPVLKIAQ